VSGIIRLRIAKTPIHIVIGFENPYIGHDTVFLKIGNKSSNTLGQWYKQLEQFRPQLHDFEGYRVSVSMQPSSICEVAYVFTLQKI
jgi:hypothetical protein